MKLDKQNLEALMKDFYILTGIKVAVFDSDYQEILSYPYENCPFCKLMQSNSETHSLCMKSNEKSFEYCRKNMKMTIFSCHAGLVEATAPLIDNGIIIGYIMIGQISDIADLDERVANLLPSCEKYGVYDDNAEAYIRSIDYKSKDQINAAVKILETITFYVLQKEIISLERKSFISKLNKYIDNNIDDDITVEKICNELEIGRSKLYEMSMKYLGTGIAKYIKIKRINKAKELLKNTEDSIYDISMQVGFADYNYFCRTFKKEVEISAKKYRELFR